MESQKHTKDFPYHCEEIGQVSGWKISYWKPGTTFLRSTPDKTLVARVVIEPNGFIDLYVYEQGSKFGKKLRHARQENGVDCDEYLQRKYGLQPDWPNYLQYIKTFRLGIEITTDNILAGLRNEVRERLATCLSMPDEDRRTLEDFLDTNASKSSTKEGLPDFEKCEKIWQILRKPNR
jgi:hypothetical protein